MYENALKIMMGKEEEGIYKTIVTNKNLTELESLLDDPSITPMLRVSITQKFWSGKKEQYKYEEERNKLVSYEEMEELSNKLIGFLFEGLNDMPIKLKENFPNVSDDSIKWLKNHLEDIKTKFPTKEAFLEDFKRRV